MTKDEMEKLILDLKERVKRLELGIKPIYGTRSAYDLDKVGGVKGEK